MTIGIIGLGLMGGSFGKALVKKTNHIVYGYDLSNTVIEKAISLNAIHYVLDTNNLSELDMLVVAIRPEFFTSSLTPFLPRLKKGAIVTDFCGVKRSIVDKMANLSKEFSNLVFVGGHPMAGRELSGINHSQSSLFDKASMILVNVNANANDIEILKDLYLSIGFSKVGLKLKVLIKTIATSTTKIANSVYKVISKIIVTPNYSATVLSVALSFLSSKRPFL